MNWLLLVYRIPRDPTASRVYIWRKLKQLGAVAVQDAIWVLPATQRMGNQEVTYHGVESVLPNVVLAANEGRSYVDAVDVKSGKLLDRLTSATKPCCVERIPGSSPVKVLVSNLGDGSLQLVEVAEDGKLTDLGRAKVGAGPKRVAFLPAAAK